MTCPFCGSHNTERHDEPKDSKTISKGLPLEFINGEWSYFVCKDCFKKSTDETQPIYADNDFVFTVVRGRIFEYIGKKQTWIEIDRQVVQFT